MAKLSELKPGQKVAFSPIYDKSKKMTGEIVDYVFLAVIQASDGTKAYAHSDDIDVLEQPKPKLSEEIQQSIADQVKAAVAAQVAAGSPTAASAPAAPEWDEGTTEPSPAGEILPPENSDSTQEKTT